MRTLKKREGKDKEKKENLGGRGGDVHCASVLLCYLSEPNFNPRQLPPLPNHPRTRATASPTATPLSASLQFPGLKTETKIINLDWLERSVYAAPLYYLTLSV
jgi:hypothetical protein